MSYPAVNNPHWDKVPDSLVAVSDLVIPVYPILPRPASLNFPPMPIWGREGALAYQQSDDQVYYCDGREWLPIGGGGGFQGSQGFTGNQGSQGFTGGQGAQGSQGSQGAQGAQGSQGAQGTQGSGGAAQTIYFHATIRFSQQQLRAIDLQQSIGSVGLGDQLTPPLGSQPIFCCAPKTGVFRNFYVTAQVSNDGPYTSLHEYRIVRAPGPVGDVVPTFTPTGIIVSFPINTSVGLIYSDSDLVNSFNITQGDLYGIEVLFNDEVGTTPNITEVGLGFDYAST